MLRAEKLKFIQNVLIGLWPDWKPTDEESRVWFGHLDKYDYETARTAAEQYFSDAGGNYRRPKPWGLIIKASLIIQKRGGGTKPAELPQTTFYIRCIIPPDDHPNRTDHMIPVYPEDLKRIDDPDYVRNCAHGLAERFKELYGGVWSVVIVEKREPSGLVGKAARDKAFRDILDGPDTRTKRWLQGYLNWDKSAQKETSGPVHISKALAESGVL